jgi:hypothetical protein
MDVGETTFSALFERYRPLALAVLRVEGYASSRLSTGSARAVRALRTADEFPPSPRSNEDDVNAKEVR